MLNPAARVPLARWPGAVLAATALVLLLLYGLQQVLVLQTGGLLLVAYLMLDTACFMPLYGAVILMTGEHLAHLLSTEAPRLSQAMRLAGLVTVVALWVVDATENGLGLWMLRGQGWQVLAVGAGSLAVCVALIAAWVWPRAPAGGSASSRAGPWTWPGWLGVAGALLGVAGWLAWAATAPGQPHAEAAGLAAGWAGFHEHKWVAVVLALAPVLLMFVVWWFGMAVQGQPARQRARYRAGVMGVLGRSRYVLLALGVFAGFTLVMDQCRDVLRANAGWLTEEGVASPWWWSLAVLGSSLGAAFVLSHSSWQWTRLAAVVQGMGATEADVDTRRAVGRFVQIWSRALAMVPLAVVCVLTFKTLSDTLLMAPVLPGAALPALHLTQAWLALFVVGACLLGGAMLWWRHRRALADTGDYYNHATDMSDLLAGGVPGRAASTSWWLWAMAPARLPVVALLGMLALRAWQVSLSPEATAAMPPTFAVVTLGVCWWLGVAGLTSVAEQRWGLPLGLVLVVATVMASGDNHLLPLYGQHGQLGHVQLLSDLTAGPASVWVMLVACLAGWWLLCALVQHSWGRQAGAWGLAVALAAVVVNGLMASPAAPVLARGHAPARTSTVALSACDLLGKLPPTAAGRPAADAAPGASGFRPSSVLVAAEGGGMRSAYWTALVLARLQAQQQLSTPLRVVLSGVSGGSVGEAIFVACRRQVRDAGANAVLDCVRQGAGRVDALTPLVSGLVFDDALAGTPVGRLAQWAGQGAPISRARPMEAAMVRAWPGLQGALDDFTPDEDEPVLLFNTTWVETGRRAVLSNRPLCEQEAPALADVLAPVSEGTAAARPNRSNVSLLTAAHASARFPVVNPVVALPAGTLGAAKGAHLVDGGYNENSGTGSVDAVWRAHVQGKPGLKPLLLLIRNGTKRPDGIRSLSDELLHPPTPDGDTRAVGWLGILEAAFKVNGLVAQAQQSTVQLVAAVKAQGGAVCVIDQISGDVEAPLGWYLSGLARQWLDHQADRQVQAVVNALAGQPGPAGQHAVCEVMAAR